jgi:hypothetical protein
VALTSDLFDVLLPFLCGAKSDFLEDAMTFREKLLLLDGAKLPNWQDIQRWLFRETI